MQRLRAVESHLAAASQRGGRGTLAVPAAAPASQQILHGVRVVELATVVAGPTCSALLADMGADVIKVEAPEGDVWRYQVGVNPKTKKDWRGEDFSSCFENTNRGKRSVVVDLKSAEGKGTMRALLGTADVFLTNVRTPALRKLGLDYDALRGGLPALIFAHLTAWGVGGPKEDDAGYDVGAFWAASGLQKYIMADDEATTGTPRFVGGIGDHVTAIHLLAGVLGALYHRKNTGLGQYVEACLARAGTHAMAVPMMLAITGEKSGRAFKAPPRTQSLNPTFNVYRCKDNRWIQLLGMEAPRHFAKMLRCLGMEQAIEADPRFRPTGKGYQDLLRKVQTNADVRLAFNAAVDAQFLTKPAAEWEPVFAAADLWSHRMSDINEVVTAPNPNAVGAFVDVAGVGHKLQAHPIKWSAAPPAPQGRAPHLGAHTAEVLAELKRAR